MTEEIINRLADAADQFGRSPAPVLTVRACSEDDGADSAPAQAADDADVQLDGEREPGWIIDGAAGWKWHRSSAESGQGVPSPVVTVKRQRVPVPPTA